MEATERALQLTEEERLRSRLAAEIQSDYMGLFPFVSREDALFAMRLLCYTPGMGGGFSFTRADFLAMDIDEILGHIEWLEEQRQREAAAARSRT